MLKFLYLFTHCIILFLALDVCLAVVIVLNKFSPHSWIQHQTQTAQSKRLLYN